MRSVQTGDKVPSLGGSEGDPGPAQGPGVLYLVSTPIGNLEDISLRAIRCLREVDWIAAEDTRHTGILLRENGISRPMISCHAHNEHERTPQLVARLRAGERGALVTDAGTPGISDPGARLVAAVRAQLPEAKIESIPGPSALTAALSIAGLATDRFLFLGFLPHKKGRQTALKKIAASEYPVVLYESPHRILKLLEELAAIGITRVSIGRELTKIHEEMISGSPRDLAADLEKRKAVRGELVVIIENIK